MTVTSAISAILIGTVAGVVGRLLFPGKQPIGMFLANPGRRRLSVRRHRDRMRARYLYRD